MEEEAGLQEAARTPSTSCATPPRRWLPGDQNFKKTKYFLISPPSPFWSDQTSKNSGETYSRLSQTTRQAIGGRNNGWCISLFSSIKAVLSTSSYLSTWWLTHCLILNWYLHRLKVRLHSPDHLSLRKQKLVDNHEDDAENVWMVPGGCGHHS